ncbi:hypothetical protein [Natronoglycomyces albus]|uniref:Uncharacterized protein n=1 Tax=Natronoglycomyces albus TaxID=2811108 RepID=A0A895XPN5_9ACTN|nr:hypothetical protein [Natronoglycomyces albus]QSB04240.1 hypothetical protein JQS30_10535 [Natronoglycomyces albus]
MSEFLGPMLVMLVAGLLGGGSYSLRQQGKTLASLLCGLVGLVLFAYGIFLIY